jgi:hypothetical protein
MLKKIARGTVLPLDKRVQIVYNSVYKTVFAPQQLAINCARATLLHKEIEFRAAAIA